MSNKKKSILAIVAVVALVSILAVCLCACDDKQENANEGESYKTKLEGKGYKVILYDNLNDEDLEWFIEAVKGNDEAVIYRFKSSEIADDYCSHETNPSEDYDLYRDGTLVITGTIQGVKDAKE